MVPPLGGILLVPTRAIEAQALMAAGYSSQGGRSWLNSTRCLRLLQSEVIEAASNLNASRVQPHISTQTLLSDERSESNSQLKNCWVVVRWL